MELTGLHILLTYQCTFECDHCFVWGSPWQNGTLSLDEIRQVLQQARDTGSVESIYFEGGEPFLYYPILVQAVKEAAGMGFQVGIVSNAYWAITVADARTWLAPFAGLIEDLSISSDRYHLSEELEQLAENAIQAAKELGINCEFLQIAQPEVTNAATSTGQLPYGESAVMYRGRAAEKLVPKAKLHPWEGFTSCPHEDLVEPGRLHLDPLGYLHICQGISLGNVFQTPLKTICQAYQPQTHPITGPLLEGGPVELVRRYALPHNASYADACHLCFTTRAALRQRFPEILTPDAMYGVPGA